MVQPAKRGCPIAVGHAQQVRRRLIPIQTVHRERCGRSPRPLRVLMEREGVA